MERLPAHDIDNVPQAKVAAGLQSAFIALLPVFYRLYNLCSYYIKLTRFMCEWKRNIEKVTRSPMEARKAYNKAASWIDIFEHPFEKPYKDRGLELLNVQPRESILELGCGTGYALLRLAQQTGPEGEITGVDIAENMLAAAKVRLQSAGVTDRVSLLRCDAAEIPLGDDIFDGVFSSFVVELFNTDRMSIVLGEIKRVLKPSGRLCIVSLSRDPETLPVRIYEWFHRLLPKRIDCRPIYVAETLHTHGFEINQQENHRMYGLPVAVVCAANSG